MSWAIFTNTLWERLGNRVRVAFAASLLCLFVVMGLGADELRGAEQSLFFALIFGAGAISGDVSRGALHLVFARPVTRSAYCVSKLAAVVALGSAFALVHLGAHVVERVVATGTVSPVEAAIAATERVLVVAGGSALMIGLSSLLPRLGDAVVWGVTALSCSAAEFWLSRSGGSRLASAVRALESVIWPTIDLRSAQAIEQTVSILTTVAVSLALAVFVMNRKEISYADLQ